MKRRQIKAKLDEIIDFSEIEQFIDTPVKRYSSGMYVRLAFAVAANLDSEILLADEVLAVGDAAFQRKCLGKMDDVSRNQGRTILFVSHNMNFIESLCEKAIRLERGRILDNMIAAREAVVSYLGIAGAGEPSIWINPGNEYYHPEFMPTKFALLDESGSPAVMPITNDQKIFAEIEGFVELANRSLNLGYALYNSDGKLLYWSYHTDTDEAEWPRIQIGINTIRAEIPPHFLNEGTYIVRLLTSIHATKWITDPDRDAPQLILVIQGGLSSSVFWVAKRPGMLAPVIKWEVSR